MKAEMSLFEKFNRWSDPPADIKIGIEVEYPIANGDALKNRASSSGHLVDSIGSWPLGGRLTRDPSVGLEVISEPLPADDIPEWYAETINYVEEEEGAKFAPTGLISGNTAGLHTHISDISRAKAEKLHRWSSEPWLQVFACSSVIEDEAPYYRVFRDNYCNLNDSIDGGNRYAVVNERSRANGHYEWRLPEPMTRKHIERLMEFLKLFAKDPETAKEYALDTLESEDNITSIVRANAIGVDLRFGEEGTVERDAASVTSDAARFWDEVQNDNACPYIYRVSLPEEGEFYAFESRREDTFERMGVEFNRDTVLRASNLQEVPEGDSARDAVLQTLNNRNGPRPKEATKYLKDVMKKKKK